MNLRQRIEDIFEDHLTNTHRIMDVISPAMTMTAEYVVSALVNDARILVLGNGTSSLAADLLSYSLIAKLQRDRPGLPAINLNGSNLIHSGIEKDLAPGLGFERQIRALAQSGDILIAFSPDGTCQNVYEAICAGRDKNMMITAVTGRDGGMIGQLLNEKEVEIRIPSNNPQRVLELQILVTHCLVDLVENMLFGTEHF